MTVRTVKVRNGTKQLWGEAGRWQGRYGQASFLVRRVRVWSEYSERYVDAGWAATAQTYDWRWEEGGFATLQSAVQSVVDLIDREAERERREAS